MEQYKSLLCMKEPPITKCVFNNNSNGRIRTMIRIGLFKNDNVLSTKFCSHHRHKEQYKRRCDNLYMQYHSLQAVLQSILSGKEHKEHSMYY